MTCPHDNPPEDCVLCTVDAWDARVRRDATFYSVVIVGVAIAAFLIGVWIGGAR